MSVNFEKLAKFTSPAILLLSTLGGGSIFAGLRYLTDLSEKMSPPKPPKNKIQLDLQNPLSGMSTESVNPVSNAASPQISKAANWWLPYLSAVAGAPIGFLGTKALYDQYQENEDKKKFELAKKQYAQKLTQAQQINKISSDTPIIDGICETLASEMEKDAGWVSSLLSKIPGITALSNSYNKYPGRWTASAITTAGLGGHYISPLAGPRSVALAPNLFALSKSNVPKTNQRQLISALPTTDADVNDEISDTMSSNANSSAYRLFNKATGKTLGTALGTLGLIAAGTGAGSLGYLISKHNDKREKEQKATYPTGVEYAE